MHGVRGVKREIEETYQDCTRKEKGKKKMGIGQREKKREQKGSKGEFPGGCLVGIS